MSLFAYNLTGAPIALVAGVPQTLPASASPPDRGPKVNVTSELKGLSAQDYIDLQVQQDASDVAYEWEGEVGFSTGALIAPLAPAGPAIQFVFAEGHPGGNFENRYDNIPDLYEAWNKVDGQGEKFLLIDSTHAPFVHTDGRRYCRMPPGTADNGATFNDDLGQFEWLFRDGVLDGHFSFNQDLPDFDVSGKFVQSNLAILDEGVHIDQLNTIKMEGGFILNKGTTIPIVGSVIIDPGANYVTLISSGAAAAPVWKPTTGAGFSLLTMDGCVLQRDDGAGAVVQIDEFVLMLLFHCSFPAGSIDVSNFTFVLLEGNLQWTTANWSDVFVGSGGWFVDGGDLRPGRRRVLQISGDFSPNHGDLLLCDTLARETLTLTANAANTETVTLGGKVYTFQTVLTDVNGNVQLGGDADESRDNLVAAINLGGTPGTDYAASMTLNAAASATIPVDGFGDPIPGVLIAVAKAVGNPNSLETLANGSWGSAALVDNDFTVTLPPGAGHNEILTLKDEKGNCLAGVVTVATSGGDTVESGADLDAAFDVREITSNAAGHHVITSN